MSLECLNTLERYVHKESHRTITTPVALLNYNFVWWKLCCFGSLFDKTLAVKADGCGLKSHSSKILAVWPGNCCECKLSTLLRMGTFLLMEATGCYRFYDRSQAEVV